MSAKKLDQSVFEGAPECFKWAAVDSCGDGWIYKNCKPDLSGRSWLATKEGGCMWIGGGYDATDWDEVLIERQDVPSVGCTGNPVDVPTAADIDWNRQEVPAGATHYDERGGFYRKDRIGWLRFDGCIWVAVRLADQDIGLYHEIPKPESITDVARSIEAARVAEKSMPFPDGDARYFETSAPQESGAADAFSGLYEKAVESSKTKRSYPHYFKDVSAVDAIDLYHVAKLYEITDPALFHAFKKIACAGKRGAKDQAQDVQEAIDALKRWQELNK